MTTNQLSLYDELHDCAEPPKVPTLSETQQALNSKIADIMFEHIGRANAITYRELAKESKLPLRTVRSTIKSLIEDEGAPIGTSSNSASGGYYAIATEAERRQALSEIDGRIRSLRKRRQALANAELMDIYDGEGT